LAERQESREVMFRARLPPPLFFGRVPHDISKTVRRDACRFLAFSFWGCLWYSLVNMASEFPPTVFTPRTLVNRAGISYEPTHTNTLYAEDINSITDEIVATEGAVNDLITAMGYGTGYVLYDLTDQIALGNRVFTFPWTVSDLGLELHYTSAPFFIYPPDFSIVAGELIISNSVPAPVPGQTLKLLCHSLIV